LHLKKDLLARGDTTASSIPFDFLEADDNVVANVQQKGAPVWLKVDASEIMKNLGGLVHDLVENYRGTRTGTKYVAFVGVISIPCIPSMLDALIQKLPIGVKSTLALFKGEDVFWWALRTTGKVIHARAAYKLL
jgi:hypothetical protein